MRRQVFYIPEYGWRVHVYYDTTIRDAEEVLSILTELGCSDEGLAKTYRQFAGMGRNNGLTYSNKALRESVVSLGRASSSRQFLNSFVHEVHHLSTHIAEASGIPLDGEEICYLSGDIAQRMYPVLIHYISRCGL